MLRATRSEGGGSAGRAAPSLDRTVQALRTLRGQRPGKPDREAGLRGWQPATAGLTGQAPAGRRGRADRPASVALTQPRPSQKRRDRSRQEGPAQGAAPQATPASLDRVDADRLEDVAGPGPTAPGSEGAGGEGGMSEATVKRRGRGGGGLEQPPRPPPAGPPPPR